MMNKSILETENKMECDKSKTKESQRQRVYTVTEIQEILGISPAGAYNLVNEGVFRSVRIGSVIRVSKKSFDRWLNKQI